MSDDLDSKTDAELNELFAVEVAKWKLDATLGSGRNFYHDPENDARIRHRADFNFCADANAVLPWLEKRCSLQHFGNSEVYPEIQRPDGTKSDLLWHVVIVRTGALGGKYNNIGSAKSFPRAAVIALIRAKRTTLCPPS